MANACSKGSRVVQNLRVGVDVGGTFTDICIMDEATGVIRIEKTSSTRDPIDGIMGGVSKAGIDLSKVALFSHGTTVATNALIPRRQHGRRWGPLQGCRKTVWAAAGPVARTRRHRRRRRRDGAARRGGSARR